MSPWDDSSNNPSNPEGRKPVEEGDSSSTTGQNRTGNTGGQHSGRSGGRRRWRSRSTVQRPDEAGYDTSYTTLPPEPRPAGAPPGAGQRSNRGRRRGQSRGDRAQGAAQRSDQPVTDRPPRPPVDQERPAGEQRPAQPAGGRGRPPRERNAQPGGPAPRPADDQRDGGAPRPGGRSRRTGRRPDGPRTPQPTDSLTSTGQPQGARRPGRGKPGGSQRQDQPAGGRTPGRTGRARGANNRTPSWGPSDYVPASTPIKARGGIRARSQGGEFGKNWWAKRWLIAMERLMDGARLQRGRRYARMGQVLSMNEAGGGIVARVQGSRPQPYKVSIRISPFTDEQWETVLDVLADQAIFAAQLLAGEMPANIEDAFATAGTSLFPARGGDLMTECSCPDWANPCKHIAATHYILGDRFDEDPFLIFRLRGRSQEEILQALRQRRSGQGEPEEVLEEPVEEPQAPLDANLEHYWEIGPGLEQFSVNVQPPSIELPLLKRLGQPDAAGRISVEENLGPAYEAMGQFALMLAFSDVSRETGENGQETA